MPIDRRAALALPPAGLLANRWFVAAVFFVFPAIVYAALITDGTFKLFAPSYGWQMFNYYALRLARFDQSIPADVASMEGLYIGGRVYIYYGMLPALMRLPLMPFVDLTRVPLATVFILSTLVVGQGALQRVALQVYARRGRSGFDLLLLVLVSVTIWLLSGSYLLINGASLYNEPYAVALMLAAIVVAMLVRDLLILERRPAGRRLIAYALVAAFSLFSRPTFAVGLYIIAAGLLLPPWALVRHGPAAALRDAVRQAVVPLIILVVAGSLFLAINYARTGHFGGGWEVATYGGYLLGKNRRRLETIDRQQFSLVRVVPNFIYILVGGHRLRETLIARAGGGVVVTYGGPFRHLLSTPFSLAMAAIGGVFLVRRRALAGPLLVATAGLAAIALLQLSYGTSQVRYSAELWPVIAWLMLLAMVDLPAPRWSRPGFVAAAVALGAVQLGSVTYTLRHHGLLRRHPFGIGSLVQPLPPALAARAIAPGSRAPEITPFVDPQR